MQAAYAAVELNSTDVVLHSQMPTRALTGAHPPRSPIIYIGTNGKLDGLEVHGQSGSVQVEAVLGGEFEEKLAECNRSNVVVRFGNADEYGGGEKIAAVGVEIVLIDELNEKCKQMWSSRRGSRSSAVHPDPPAALPRASLRMRDFRRSLSTMTWGGVGGRRVGGRGVRLGVAGCAGE
jgi:hypothetical protein